ncbi:iron-sulfur cluster biosynthesis family protein, partial [Aerococcus sp. L_32]
DEVLETHIGQVHIRKSALKFLGHDNRIDFDDFRQVFVLIVDGHVMNDNIYLQKAS